MNANLSLGFIGLGVMGGPMCRNILKEHDGPVHVADLNAAAVEALVKDGASAADMASIAEKADIIFLSLPGGPEVEQVVLGPGGLFERGRAGQIIADLSTCPVELERRIAARLTEKSIIYADAPVTRTRQAAIDGTLSIMIGTDEKTFTKLKPILSATATDITHAGPVGCGQVIKLMNNMVLFQNVVAIAEALTVGSRAGGRSRYSGKHDLKGLRRQLRVAQSLCEIHAA